jgi:hypothetical protein
MPVHKHQLLNLYGLANPAKGPGTRHGFGVEGRNSDESQEKVITLRPPDTTSARITTV